MSSGQRRQKIAKSVDDFQLLVCLPHLDDEDGLIYVTTRVVQQRGYIVAYWRLLIGHGDKLVKKRSPFMGQT